MRCPASPAPSRFDKEGLCADGNDSGTDAQHTAQDGRLLAKLNKYWEWIQEEPRIVGLNPYHWDDTNACTLKNTSACTHMCYVRTRLSETFSICVLSVSLTQKASLFQGPRDAEVW